MTKLGEWLFGLTIFFGIYTALITKQIKHKIIDEYFFEIQILPAVLIVLLGVSCENLFLSIKRSLSFLDLRSYNRTLPNSHFQRMQGGS